MPKLHFRPYIPNQTVLFPQRIDENISENAPVRIVNAIVDNLNLDNFKKLYEDAMNNGQTKPGYNLQIGTENQFITDFAFFPNPTDTLTLIPFFHSFRGRYNRLPSTAAADSDYGSEENYRFMDENGIEAFVKYNFFHKEQRPRYVSNPFHPEIENALLAIFDYDEHSHQKNGCLVWKAYKLFIYNSLYFL